MKVVILYRPKSEHGTSIESFVRDFRMRHDVNRLEMLDVDSREGIAMASLYDIMSYPAIMALRDDGSVLHSWQGDSLPLLDELAYYTSAITG